MFPLPLADRLRHRIELEGPLRFDDFQEAALYDPDGGYYESSGRVGRTGDFVTAPSWHPAFAASIARLAREVGLETGHPPSVLDVGTGEGELLGRLSTYAPDVALAGVERSTARRARAAAAAPRARLFEGLSDTCPKVFGLILAYELVDALPVRALEVGAGGALAERRVGLDDQGRFCWLLAPAVNARELLSRLATRGVSLEEGQRLEIRPGATALARSLAAALGQGLLLVFDYGAPARALYGPLRGLGTLEAFASQRVTRDVLSEPGRRDITSWVDFSELGDALIEEGLTVHGLVSQARFLLGLGLAEQVALETNPFERNALAKLFAPGGMGESLRVLVASRDCPVSGADAVRPAGAPPARR